MEISEPTAFARMRTASNNTGIRPSRVESTGFNPPTSSRLRIRAVLPHADSGLPRGGQEIVEANRHPVWQAALDDGIDALFGIHGMNGCEKTQRAGCCNCGWCW